MKNKISGILIILILTVIMPCNVFAGQVGYDGIDTNIAIGGTDAAQSSVAVTNRIVGVLRVAGTVIAVIALMIIGIRYMFSSVQEKAQMKGVIGYYIIGCVLVFATSNVLAFIYDVVKDVPHSYGEMYETVPATCVSQGKAEYKCIGKDSLCNCTEDKPHIYEVKTPINPDAHNMGEWVVEKQKTCTEDGIETRICVNGCGKTETRTIEKFGHNYQYGIIRSATCTTEGYEGNKCTRCGDEKDTTILAATGHSSTYNSTVTTPATCTTEGVKTYTCKNGCGDTYTEKIAATGHSSTYNSSITTPATCTAEGLKTYTCKNGCGDTYTEKIAANGHTETTLEAVAATCITTGLTAGKKCSVCNTVLQPQTEIAATGHTEKITIAATPATCTQKGKTAKKECTVCRTVLEEQTEIPATGHKDTVILEEVSATCTATGLTSGKKCSVCGAITQQQTEIAATGHTETTLEAVAATCITTGLTAGKKCSVCGAITQEQTQTPMTSHSYSVINYPKKTTGTQHYKRSVCDVCGVEKEDLENCTYNKALGFLWNTTCKYCCQGKNDVDDQYK